MKEYLLSKGIGLKNLFTCYDNEGKSFIIKGNKYLEISKYFNKKIAHYQSIANPQQIDLASEYGKDTKRIKKLYKKKDLQIDYFFHSATKAVVEYCAESRICKVVIGDIKGIRKNASHGKANNQKLHALPYGKIYSLLTYKLNLYEQKSKKGLLIPLIELSNPYLCNPSEGVVVRGMDSPTR